MRIILAILFGLLALPAQAETLQAAMMRAYQTNPDLRKEQAKLRAIDERVPLAKSGQRPSIDFNSSIGQRTFKQGAVDNDSTPRSLGFSLTQPIYKGGSIESGIDSAEKAVLAARATYNDAEQTLFINVVTSYFDVWLYQATVKINKKNEEVLGQELKAARERFEIGESTRTDVAQADSRYAGSTAARIESEGQLAAAKATYEKVIGNTPSELAAPDVNFPIPSRLDEMIDLAEANSPKVINAKFVSDSAERDIATAEGALLPQVDVQAAADRGWDTGTLATTGKTDNASIMARLTMPLYRSGADYARTRAAKETASQRRVEIRAALDTARETAVRAWESLNTAQATIKSRQKQVEAAELAFLGVKEESKVGTRTILDRLNAEAEALQARVNLVKAQRDKAVALFLVKSAIGELTAAQLKLPVTLYDPAAHYNSTKDKWVGLGVTEEPEFKNPEVTPDPAGEPQVEPAADTTPETKPAPAIQP